MENYYSFHNQLSELLYSNHAHLGAAKVDEIVLAARPEEPFWLYAK